jgi:hypothetical protein
MNFFILLHSELSFARSIKTLIPSWFGYYTGGKTIKAKKLFQTTEHPEYTEVFRVFRVFRGQKSFGF